MLYCGWNIGEEARNVFAAQYKVKAFEATEAILDEGDINVVCICTPSGLHASLAVRAAGAGKHIVVEKPMAITPSECNDIIRACEINNVKVAVIS